MDTRRRRNSCRRRPQTSRRARFESLEDRRLLAVGNGPDWCEGLGRDEVLAQRGLADFGEYYVSSERRVPLLRALTADTSGEATFFDPEAGGRRIAGREIIVGLQPGVQAEHVLSPLGEVRPLAGTPDQFVVQLREANGSESLTVANALDAKSFTTYALPNFRVEGTQSNALNDPLYPDQWHLHNTGQGGGTSDADVDAPEAWKQHRPDTGIVIAILDDGVQLDHPDLPIWENAAERDGQPGEDDDDNGYIDDVNGWDFANGDADPSPRTTGSVDRHGTPVAGVAAAAGDNNEGGAGAAYGSRIMAVKPYNADSNGNFSVTIAAMSEAIYYAAGRTKDGTGTWKSSDVLNMSFSLGASFTAIDAAMDWAHQNGREGKGTVMFASSGNNNASSISYPASHPETIAVGASTNQDVRWNGGFQGSNYGTGLDFLAPSAGGTLGITTTDRTGADGYASGNYTATFGGTSSASPLAAGVGALLLAANPGLTADDVRQVLRETADKIGGVTYDASGYHNEYGFGRINANEALKEVGWVETFGQAGSNPDDGGSGTVMGTDGSVYVIGTVYFTGDSGNFPGPADISITKFSAAGDLQWQHQIGGTEDDRPSGIAIDADDNIYIAASFRDTVDFDPGSGTASLTSAGSFDAVLASYDKDGNYRWAHRYGQSGGAWDLGSNVTVEGDDVVLVGRFGGTVDFDPGAGTLTRSSAGGADVFVLKASRSDGSTTWVRSVGGSSNDAATGVDIAGNGDVLVTGNFYGTADFDPGSGVVNRTSVSSGDGFALSLDSQGNFDWVRQQGGSGYDLATDVRVDAQGNAYTLGMFQGTLDLDESSGDELTSAGGSFDHYLAQYDTNGQMRWFYHAGNTGNDRARRLELDDDGNAYIVGMFEFNVDFDSTGSHTGNDDIVVSHGQLDAVVYSVSRHGDFLWARGFGGAVDDEGKGVTVDTRAADSLGHVVATGYFGQEVEFDTGTGVVKRESAGGDDAFVTEFIRPRVVAGTVFDDSNENGTLDSGEDGLSGWTVYVDANDNGTLDGGELTHTTDAEGNYRFAGLAIGTHAIRQVTQSGFTPTSPSGGKHEVVVERGTVAVRDFGNKQQSSGGQDYTVSADDDPSGESAANDGSKDKFILRREGDLLSVYVRKTKDIYKALSVDYASVDTLTINGSGDADIFIFDTKSGNPIPAGGLVLNGGGKSDQLALTTDVDFTMSDELLSINGFGEVTLDSVDKAKMTGGNGDNVMDASGFSGKLTLRGKGGNDTLIAGSGSSKLLGDGGDDTLTGGSGKDKLIGKDGNDVLRGGGNKDTLKGDDGNDELHGEDGNDKIYGGAGLDVMTGGNGADKMYGNDGADEMDGGADNDVMEGGQGADIVRGGLDDDTLNGSSGSAADAAIDQLFGDDGFDTAVGLLDASDLLDSIEEDLRS